MFPTSTISVRGLPIAMQTSPKPQGASRKRKRIAMDDSTSEKPLAKASINVDKLLKQMNHHGEGKLLDVKDRKGRTSGSTSTFKSSFKASGRDDKKEHSEKRPKTSSRFEPQKSDKRNKNRSKMEKKGLSQKGNAASSSNTIVVLPRAIQSKDEIPEEEMNQRGMSPIQSIAHPRFKAPRREKAADVTDIGNEPSSQIQKLRGQLVGGKFRILNEKMYTSSAEEVRRMMSEENAFEDYHTGFRAQSSQWPVHPVQMIVESLKDSLTRNALVADFGCGDATLARALNAADSSDKRKLVKNDSSNSASARQDNAVKVISFDLFSQSPLVVEAECSSVPLPGGFVDGHEIGCIVDCVICCLSLMPVDWIGMIHEARRVLVPEGLLKIAEVSSRFTNVDAFVDAISKAGFKLIKKDVANTHFILFDFIKIPASAPAKRTAETDRKTASLLKPCVYRKR